MAWQWTRHVTRPVKRSGWLQDEKRVSTMTEIERRCCGVIPMLHFFRASPPCACTLMTFSLHFHARLPHLQGPLLLCLFLTLRRGMHRHPPSPSSSLDAYNLEQHESDKRGIMAGAGVGVKAVDGQRSGGLERERTMQPRSQRAVNRAHGRAAARESSRRKVHCSPLESTWLCALLQYRKRSTASHDPLRPNRRQS